MSDWWKQLKYDPSAVLIGVDDIAYRYSFEKDILGKTDIELEDVWSSKPVRSILKQQQPDGSWKYPSNRSWSKLDYDQYQAFKYLGELIEKYRLTKEHGSIQKVAEYFWQFLAPEGDIRGIYGNQTSPNYSAAILELLIKASYRKDTRIKKSIHGLLRLRQNDGGWALAFRTKGQNLGAFDLDNTIEPDTSMPSSAMVTGVVLRALVLHPQYNALPETKKAATIVADSFFTRDNYADRQPVEYWTRFGFPFVYTDIVSSLDSLTIIGGFEDHPKVQKALKWLRSQQTNDGVFDIRTTRGKKDIQRRWMALAIYRIFKRLRKKL